MSSKALSPTASILRSSRLFSLPPPLPKPAPELTLGVTFNSDTATTPYPTQAAIVTTQSARSRGDWGLKRPLPLRSTTKTSTPVIRVHAVDSPQHITDFSSAADHVLTLEKWRELNLSISRVNISRVKGIGGSLLPTALTSAFESEVDRTREDPRTTSNAGGRWKFAGPWLGGRTEGEFERYLDRQVRNRKREFKEFLRQHLKEGKANRRLRVARDEGRLDGDESVAEVSDEEVDAELKTLRQDPLLFRLGTLIRAFLDLPALPGGSTAYDEVGPPMMHPSGGLSYLRTHAVLPNHPLLGPQAKPAPVEARILIPGQSTTGLGVTPKVGVAGVVTDDTSLLSALKDKSSGFNKWDTTTPGGGKTWVHPTKATIDAHGRINLRFDLAQEETIAIRKGQWPKEDETETEKRSSRPSSGGRSEAEVTKSFHSTSKAGYGIEDASVRRKREPRTTTFMSDRATQTVHDELQGIGSRF